jgi:hypothetical protein
MLAVDKSFSLAMPPLDESAFSWSAPGNLVMEKELLADLSWFIINMFWFILGRFKEVLVEYLWCLLSNYD